MQTHKFSISWIKLRESFDSESRSLLLSKCYSRNKDIVKNIIDLGGGNGSFLRWCHSKNIIYDSFLITDHDQALLKNFYVTTKKYLSKYPIKLIKNNTSSYLLERDDIQKNSIISLKNQEMMNSIKLINNYSLISLSAVTDLLSKNYIKKLFDEIKIDKYIYFSICFDGRVKWKNKNKYDKYIISMFNKHQRQEKTLGMAMGSDSIKIIKDMSLKRGYKVSIADSSWVLDSDSSISRDFQISYLNTICKPLKSFDLIDKNILKEWFDIKSKDIMLKKSNLMVGHKDLLIKT